MKNDSERRRSVRRLRRHLLCKSHEDILFYYIYLIAISNIRQA